MKYAADFRQDARNILQGKWSMAVLVGLVAILLGGAGSNGPEVKLNIDTSGISANLQIAGQNVVSWGSGDPALRTFLVGSALYITAAALVLAVVYFVLGSIVSVGYARVNLELYHGETPSFTTLFSYLPYWKTTATTRLLRSVYTLLWTILFIIPGIVATYSYAMTDYILAEHPELTASEAIARSKEIMEGNRWRLFCLHISFIGWAILSAFTLGIGNLFLTPYKQAADAVFYRELVSPTQADFC